MVAERRKCNTLRRRRRNGDSSEVALINASKFQKRLPHAKYAGVEAAGVEEAGVERTGVREGDVDLSDH